MEAHIDALKRKDEDADFSGPSLTSVGRLCKQTKQRLILRDYTELKTSPGHKKAAAGLQIAATYREQVVFHPFAAACQEEAVIYSFPTLQLFKP